MQSFIKIYSPFISASHARYIFITIGDALTFIHSKGYVHRDVKPTNLLLFPDGNLKLADCGLAEQMKVCGLAFVIILLTV